MKIFVAMMLVFVAFSAVAMAELSIQDAALDLLVAREDAQECASWMNLCGEKKCCEGYVCQIWCKYKLG
uniref:Kappa-LhTx-1 n=1 Tax=Pandercetes sp. SD662 TaxID=1476146 RepID=A0A8F4X4H7_9ARAC|nr:kappa-LhTx-1 precursor [Pandercetes sp. SD662]